MSALCSFCGADGFCFRKFLPHWGSNSSVWMLRVFLLWLLPLTLLANPPGITVQPQKRTVVQGTNYTFTVSATGTDPLSYQWRRDNSDLTDRTNAALALTAIQTSDAGLYTVVVTNVEGAVTSAPARLTVR